MKRVLEKREDEEAHRYFVRFGKGVFGRRFLIKFNRGKRIKVKGSFELANDFVKFVRENKDLKFSGKILSKEKIPGKEAKKKGGVFVYDVVESTLEEFGKAYYYLLDANDSDIILKIKKILPKPGKNEGKIDDGFCVMDLDLKYLDNVKKVFFWDVPECKKAEIEHELRITEIGIPKGESDPVKIRELAKRKGKIVRKIIYDEKEIVKEFELEA